MPDTTVGTAYVQIIPTTKGITGMLTSELGTAGSVAGASAGKISGASFGKQMLAKFGGIFSVSAIAGIAIKGIKAAYNEYANYQQNVGGVETMFGINADTVTKNAFQAYKTAGISANEYMEQVTSFSARLLQSLGGDTKKAAKIADMAIIDMADNANKFGTDITAIQNAYQGFSKQNYTIEQMSAA